MIKGSKIVLGPLMPGDADAMFRWINDVESARLDYAYRPTDWNAFQGWIDSLSKDKSRVMFAIRRIGASPIIGFVGLHSINPVHRSADLSVRIGEEANGTRVVGPRRSCWR